MLKKGTRTDGVARACGRLDELLRQAGPDLAGWMISVAELRAAGSRPSAFNPPPSTLHLRPRSGARS